MQACISARESGSLSRDAYKRTISTHLLKSFTPAPHLRFNGDAASSLSSSSSQTPPNAALLNTPHSIAAHKHGVNALALDKFDGRILLSGGADGSIRLWDLESRVDDSSLSVTRANNHNSTCNRHLPFTFAPTATVPRAAAVAGSSLRNPHATPLPGHTHGVTHLDFYPFDPDAFLSSSFDNSLILWSTSQAKPAATFDLGATVYAHATSSIAPHLLVACATQHSSVRLVDLKSGAAIQTLVGSGSGGGPVLATAWSPRDEHILVSGHADGSIRVWDVRRASAMIGLFDKEDSLGVVHRLRHAVASGASSMTRSRASAKAHADAVNALAWTDDGRYVVSGGLDRRIRVWDAATGANTLASFGPVVQNPTARHQTMIISPSVLTLGCREVLFWPNEREILALDLHEGKVLSRLRTPGIPSLPTPSQTQTQSRGRGRGGSSQHQQPPLSSSPVPSQHRITAIAWRGVGGHGRQSTTRMGGADAIGGIYAAHADGQIRAWMPTLPGPDDDGEVDEDELVGGREAEKIKKRKALNEAFMSLMAAPITFTDAPRP
jgi:DNA excision repair protein ERCC-8